MNILILLKLLTILFSLIGIFICYKIIKEKKTGKPMVCPLNLQCETVMHSKYSKFLGFKLETIGVLYYLYILVSYSLILIFPTLSGTPFELFAIWATSFGFAFSIYLTVVQGLFLRAWCSWCLSSAINSTIIFGFSFYTVMNLFPLEKVLTENINFFYLSDIILVALATSLVLITEIFTFKFLKDFKITEAESKTLTALWQFIWLFIFDLAILTIILNAFNTNPEIVVSTTRNIKVLVIITLSAISSFYLLPKIYKYSKNQIVNVSFVAWSRIVSVSISSVLLISWFLVPASTLANYILLSLIALLFTNIILIFLDLKQFQQKS